MRPECKKLLFVVKESADRIMDFVGGKSVEEYEENALIR
jgi:hypothetical protein